MTRINVRLTPRGGRDRIDGWDGDVLRVRVAAPPVDGKANEAMLRMLAKRLGVTPSSVRVVSGAQSRVKIVEVEGLSAEDMRERIGRA